MQLISGTRLCDSLTEKVDLRDSAIGSEGLSKPDGTLLLNFIALAQQTVSPRVR